MFPSYRLVHPGGTFARVVFLLSNSLLTWSVCWALWLSVTNIFPVDSFVVDWRILCPIHHVSIPPLTSLHTRRFFGYRLLLSYPNYLHPKDCCWSSSWDSVTKIVTWFLLYLLLRSDLPLLNQTSSEPFAPYVFPSSKTKALWETWVLWLWNNLFLRQNPLNQRLKYLKLVTVRYFSNMIFFVFDENHHLLKHLPRLHCSRNSRKSSYSKRGYWACLRLMFSFPAIRFLICFLSILNLFAVCNKFLSLL